MVFQSAACEADTRADNKHNLKAEPECLLMPFMWDEKEAKMIPRLLVQVTRCRLSIFTEMETLGKVQI